MRDDPLLVAYTLSLGLPSRGVKAEHQELLITLGAQNALWLACQVLARDLKTGRLTRRGRRSLLSGDARHPRRCGG